MIAILNFITIILIIVSILCLSLGFYPLLSLKRDDAATVHHLLLLNLNIASLTLDILPLLEILIFRVVEISIAKRFLYHSYMIDIVLSQTVYRLTMLAIIVDKLMEIKLNLKYSVYWDEYKTVCLNIASWFFGCSLFTITLFFHHLVDFRFERYYPPFIIFPYKIIYIMFSTIAMGFIFYKFNQSRLLPAGSTSIQVQKREGFFRVFFKSRFVVPVSLTITYIVFILTPSLIYNVMYLGKTTGILMTAFPQYYRISKCVSRMLNSVCVLFEPKVKRRLKRLLRRRFPKIYLSIQTRQVQIQPT